MRTVRLLLAATAVATSFAAVAPAQATMPRACRNQVNDATVLDVVGVDQPDVKPGQNGYVLVCYNAPVVGGNTSGARVYRDDAGVCVAVVVNGKETGCTRSSLLGDA
ncbi:MAG TPA: hypothetical protein VGX28_09225 [Frankiaceae bacterium]|jgi:hypothetical protein|nr:hypothetical protein [Frankiaceae bacterium]